MPYYTYNEKIINQNIVDIFTEGLIETFIEDTKQYNYYSIEGLDDYIKDEVIENIFNRETCNILNYWNKKYILDCETLIELLKIIKEDLEDSGLEDLFCDMFNRNENSETKIINMYSYVWIKEHWCWIGNDFYEEEYDCDKMDRLFNLFRNIGKYNLNTKKHSGLINLYTKLDIKNKQKKTISKILNNKFDMDILQNILDCY
jgi:hypothetical protein